MKICKGLEIMIINEIKVAFPGQEDFVKCSLEIRSGKIHRISDKEIIGKQIIDGRGLTAFPGMIDPHVHFNTPGYEEREDFYHGSCFAASGGVTTVIDMPCTSIPPVTCKKNFLVKKNAVEKQSIIDYCFYGGVSGQSFEDLESNLLSMKEEIAGVKVYLLSGMSTFRALDYDELGEVFAKCKELGLPVLIHAEDSEFVKQAEKKEKAAGSQVLNYYRSRPEAAELIAIERAGKLAEAISADVHIVHAGSGTAALMAAEYGMTVETCPHYLSFTLNDFIEMGSVLKVAPVIKKAPAAEELWKFLGNGVINFAASDHAAAGKSAKKGENIWDDYSGIAGCGTMFLYLYSEGFIKKRLSLSRFLKVTAENAAKRYGFSYRKGMIAEGMDADIVIIDPNDKTEVRAADFYSKCELSPWEGMNFSGKIKYTIRRGEIIYIDKDGITAEKGSGKYLKPKR